MGQPLEKILRDQRQLNEPPPHPGFGDPASPRDPPKADLCEPFDWARWEGRDLPSRRWIIEGLVSVGTVAAISGDGGTGKSLLAQQLLTAAVLPGRTWLGYGIPPIRAFGMFCEDDQDELAIRQGAINHHYGTRFSELAENIMIETRFCKDSFLVQWQAGKFGERPKAQPTPLWHDMVSKVTSFGAQIIVLDTVRKTMAGDENNRFHIEDYILMLRQLAVRIQGAVIVLMHPSNEGIASGSGLGGNRACRNELRNMMYFTTVAKDESGLKRKLHVKKNNYGPTGGKIDLQYNNGVFVRPEDVPPPDLQGGDNFLDYSMGLYE